MSDTTQDGINLLDEARWALRQAYGRVPAGYPELVVVSTRACKGNLLWHVLRRVATLRWGHRDADWVSEWMEEIYGTCWPKPEADYLRIRASGQRVAYAAWVAATRKKRENMIVEADRLLTEQAKVKHESF